MKIILPVFAIILSVFALSILLQMFGVVDVERIWRAPKNCDYVLPPHYHLKYNETNKTYVIYCDWEWSGGYMDVDGIIVRFWDEPYPYASKFKDSCRAKGALEKHLNKKIKEEQSKSLYK